MHDGRDERALPGIVQVAERRRGLQLDEEEPAQQSRAVVELAGLLQHLAQRRDVREALPQLRQRQPIEAREVRQEVVVVHDHPVVACQLHVDLDDAHARHVRRADGLHRVLDGTRRVLAEVGAEAAMPDGERAHVEVEEVGDRGGQREQRRGRRVHTEIEERECRDQEMSDALRCPHAGWPATPPCKRRTGRTMARTTGWPRRCGTAWYSRLRRCRG